MKKYKVSNIKCKNLTLLESAAIQLPESFTITTKKKYSKKELMTKIAGIIKENYGEELKSCVLEELEVSGPVLDQERFDNLTDRMQSYSTDAIKKGKEDYSYNQELENLLDQVTNKLIELDIFDEVSEKIKELNRDIQWALEDKFDETPRGKILNNFDKRAYSRP